MFSRTRFFHSVDRASIYLCPIFAPECNFLAQYNTLFSFSIVLDKGLRNSKLDKKKKEMDSLVDANAITEIS